MTWLADFRDQNRIFWQYATDLFQRNYQAIEPGVVFGAAIAAIGFPTYFLMWEYLFPQPYENLSLRLIAGLMCVGLALKNHWPRLLKPYAPVYFFLTVTYCLPFFFGYMMLRSGFSPIWMLSELTALFVMVLLLDWLSLLACFIIGSVAAWIVCMLSGGPPLNFADYLEYLPVFVFVLLCGLIFNFRSERSQLERLRAMAQLGQTITQSLSSPLNQARAAAQGLSETLPKSIAEARTGVSAPADKESLERAFKQLDAAIVAAGRIDTDIRHALTLIDLFAARGYGEVYFQETAQELSMRTCVKTVVEEYPYRNARQRARVQIATGPDFNFQSPERLIHYALMAVMDNALKALDRKGGGTLSIGIEVVGAETGAVTFTDQGVGIPAHVMPRIFDRFYSYNGGNGAVGTGLSFTKSVVDFINGSISVQSEDGAGTNIKIALPTLSKDATQPTSSEFPRNGSGTE